MKFFSVFVLITAFFVSCDSRKSKFPKEPILSNLLCYSYGSCRPQSSGIEYGMVGDSWTDLLFGQPVIPTIRTYLENTYNYKIVGASLGGRLLSDAVLQGLHYQVIDQAGPDIKYMLISLSGNDLLQNAKNYRSNISGETANRLNSIQFNLKTMIATGNSYKINKWGGAPVLWIIHGYDYSNPNVGSPLGSDTTACKSELNSFGFTDSDIQSFLPSTLDSLNNVLKQTTTTEPYLRYIDLRATLGGPPYSNASVMFDCIHPNGAGFASITSKYVAQLKFITGK